MTGKEFIEDRINTGSRFLQSLHHDTREKIALLLEQYAALRQPPVSGELSIAVASIRANYELWSNEEITDGTFSYHLQKNLLQIEKELALPFNDNDHN